MNDQTLDLTATAGVPQRGQAMGLVSLQKEAFIKAMTMKASDFDLAMLPPLSPIDDGRHRSWVIAAAEPGFDYQGTFHKVDAAWIDQQVSEFHRLTDKGYLPPVLSEHKRDGTRLGDVENLTSWADTSGKIHLLAQVAWAISNAEELIESQRLKYTSPSFAVLTDDRGRRFESPYVLTELSIVSAPHQKGIGDVHILNQEQTTMSDTKEAPAVEETPAPVLEEENTQASLSALAEQIQSLTERVAALEESTPEDEEEEEDGAEMDEVAALREQVQQLQVERERDAFAYGQKELLIGLSEDDREALFQAYKASPQAFQLLTQRLKSDDAPKVQSQIQTTPWSVRMGESQDLDTSQPTKADLYAQALAEAGSDASKALEIYKSKVNSLN